MSDWQIKRQRAGAILGITFTSPAWPHGGQRGETLYLKVTAAQGWKRLVSGGPGFDTRSHMEEGLSLSQAIRRVPGDLREDVVQAHRDVVDAALGEVGKWGSRLGRYREELRDVVGSEPDGSR